MSSAVRLVCVFLFCSMAGLDVQGQDVFSTYIGAGLGRHFEKAFPYNEHVNNGRIAVSVSQYARLLPGYSIGISAMASGRLSSILGGAPPGDYYDAVSNTQIINYNNLNAATYLIKNKMDWPTKNDFTFFTEIGIGVSRYQYIQSHKSSFAIAPEIGFIKDNFQFTASFIYGGRTPAFTQASLVNSTVLAEIKSNRLYLMLAYRLFKF